VAALIFSLLMGMLFILPTGENPLSVYAAWFEAGFSCHSGGGQCALLTALQYATPMILSGLSAMMAFRVGLISIGQFGQMVIGAGVTAWLVSVLPLPPLVRGITAVALAISFAALWSAIPGFLRAFLQINEVITTFLMNSFALAVVAPFSFWRIPDEMQLTPLVATTKLTVALFIALLVALGMYIYLWRTSAGLTVRMSGQAVSFAQYAGMKARWAIVGGMAVSGMLAGLAGALEVLGVHYRFVSNFSSVDEFDGIVVSLLGQLHPLGVVLAAGLLGGLRLGALNGLQLQTAVPRELGTAVLALTMILIAAPRFLNIYYAIIGRVDSQQPLRSQPVPTEE
jgi:simple sugar transport system permease protein